MKWIRGTNKYILIILFCVLTTFLFLYIGGERLIYPSLHMDESFYIGAALRILEGDIFLNGYSFDKFFILPYTIAIGILIGGENHVGFRISSLLIMLVLVPFVTRWILKLSSKSIIDQVASLALFFGIFLSSFMMNFHLSSFADPFLLSFLIFSYYLLCEAAENADLEDKYLSSSYHFFAVASLFKLSSVMWGPMFLGYWIYKKKSIFPEVFKMLKTIRIWIILGISYSLFNPNKLGPILWFNHLTDSKKPALFERVMKWIEVFLNIFENSLLVPSLFILFLSLTISFYWMRQKKKNDQSQYILWLFIFPIIAHLVGLVLSRAATFNRYTYIVFPQLVIALIAINSQIKSGTLKILMRISFLIIGLTFLVIETDHNASFEKEELPTAQFTRNLYQIRDEVPDYSVIHQDRLLWYLYPFNSNSKIQLACSRKECIDRMSLGYDHFQHQFLLGDIKANTPLFQRIGSNTDSVENTYEIANFITEELLRDRLRLKSSAKSLDIKINSQDITRNFKLENGSWRTRPELKVEIDIDSRSFPYIGTMSFKIIGKALVLKSEKFFGFLGFGSALRIERIEINGKPSPLLDLFPILYKGYTIPLERVNIPFNFNKLEYIQDIQYDEINDKVFVKVIN